MYYIVYKVTNQINGKIYIGTHKTKDLNDGYMGSGKYLKHSQTKHGIENFSKEILFVYDEPGPMYAKEAELVNEDFLAEENTYNLKIGGFGGWDYNNTEEGQKLREHSYEKWQQAGIKEFKRKYKEVLEFRNKHKKHLKEIASKASKVTKEKYPNGTFYGKKHKEETKLKIGKANSEHQKGKGNSQYNTRWIFSLDEKISKKISVNDDLPEGWNEGRKIKFVG